MGNLKAAFDKAQLEAAEAAARLLDARGKKSPLKPIQEVLTDGTVDRSTQEHCFDAWIIVRAVSGSERRAKLALEREGHEVFYPVGRMIKRLPQRFISSKTRHKHRHGLLQVDVRNPYPGYVFCRRFDRNEMPAKLGVLEAVIGVCMFGDEIAKIPDWRIEMLRVAQDCGEYDRVDPLVTSKELNLGELRYTKAAAGHWSSKPKSIGRLDTTRSVIHFVEEFGRITRVVAARGDRT